MLLRSPLGSELAGGGSETPVVSFIIATFNRREAVLRTLGELQAGGAGSPPNEVIVVDNASADGTSQALRRDFPNVRLFTQTINRGPCAKNIGVAAAEGELIVFLDDDSCPQAGCVDRMIQHFQFDRGLGAAIFGVDLLGGGQECSAYPDVFAGCGVGLRAEALRQVGFLPDDFFMQAEEYDLSLRLIDGGWGVQRFDDVRVTHLKTPQARFHSRVMRLDVRNNLTLIGRYFPDEWVVPFAADWARRYRMIAKVNKRLPAYYAGLAAGLGRLALRRGRRPVSAKTFETFTKMRLIEQRLGQAKQELALKRILLIDLGKNILPYWRAAANCSLEVVAIADERLGGHGFAYHGCPILKDAEAIKMRFDAAIVSNMSPVHAGNRKGIWSDQTDRAVVDLIANDGPIAALQAA